MHDLCTAWWGHFCVATTSGIHNSSIHPGALLGRCLQADKELARWREQQAARQQALNDQAALREQVQEALLRAFDSCCLMAAAQQATGCSGWGSYTSDLLEVRLSVLRV